MKSVSYIITMFLLSGIFFPELFSGTVKIDGIPLAQQHFADKEAMTAAIYEEILFRFFTRAGVPPNEKDTLVFLEKLNALLPSGVPGKSQTDIHFLAKQRKNQLSCAARKFFSARIPELEMVENDELQKAYQQNLERFTSPGNLQCSAMMFNDLNTAEKARAELLQGSRFETVSQKYQAISPKGTEREFLPLLKTQHPRLFPMLVSNVLRGEKYFFVVLVRQFTPAAVIPLAEVQAYLKEEIIAQRTAELLTHLLRAELPGHKIEIPNKERK